MGLGSGGGGRVVGTNEDGREKEKHTDGDMKRLQKAGAETPPDREKGAQKRKSSF